MLGLEWEDLPDDECEVWPDNELAALVFIRMVTQWQVGPAGPVGLKYESLPVVMKILQVPQDEELDVLDCIRVMEAEVIKMFGERRE
ncbi:DUF1799 domain-containing protein [Lysobacter enzymogenes]|uniref:DUF1799 domain-containing protein n=1 Tax=Lysobacter enzymogenes TaxID=69 RepID=UPI001A96AC0B|nr:DUF1799 domain-containing protein [Lysobacter enzymogenes]QQP97935.1 DUF1799 domain-containing protein [Lysobacter enzymogenes]